MVVVFDGPAYVADMVKEALEDRGIGALVEVQTPLASIYGRAAGGEGPAVVLVAPEDARLRAGVIAECVAPFQPEPESP